MLFLNPVSIVRGESDLFIQLVRFLLLSASASICQESKRNFTIINWTKNTANHTSWIADQVFASDYHPVDIRNNTRQRLFRTFLLMLGGLLYDFLERLLFEAVQGFLLLDCLVSYHVLISEIKLNTCNFCKDVISSFSMLFDFLNI